MRKLLIVFILSLSKVTPLAAMSFGELKKQVSKAEKKYNIPTGILDSIITYESNYKIPSVNPENMKKDVFVSSFGLGQLTFATALAQCSLKREDILNPIKNIFCSAKILRYQLDRFNNSLLYAISAYNQGTPCVCDGIFYKRELNNVIQACKNFKTKKAFKCSAEDVGRFLNQDYVDKIISIHRKIHPNSTLFQVS